MVASLTVPGNRFCDEEEGESQRFLFSLSSLFPLNSITLYSCFKDCPCVGLGRRKGYPRKADLQRQMKRVWYPPKGTENRATTVKFKVLTDGATKNRSILKSSGDKVLDDACMKALEVASPLRPLPAGAPHCINIEFKFQYNAHK